VQRPGTWVAELTGLPGLAGWPPGMRVIARKERPHPGAQLRLTDRPWLTRPPSPDHAKGQGQGPRNPATRRDSRETALPA
jgi:hypothetical protein